MAELFSTRQDATAVVRRLRESGHVAYFAGGCVRDELLGLEPKDYDVATDAPPERVRELFRNTQAVGAAFGVILVRVNASQVEVATFRTDSTYGDGRRPDSVRFTTAEEDAQRRDFTINGMFLDPLDGQVIDYVGGQRDLSERRLRAIGNPAERFAEDHLRMLRAVRFAARFALTVDDATAAAIVEHAAHLRRISPERIADELRRMWTVPSRVTAWNLLRRLGLLDVLFRDLPMRRQSSDAEPGMEAIFHATAAGQPISFGLALAAGSLAYLSPGASGDVRELLAKASVTAVIQSLRRTLRISNEESDEASGALAGAGLLLQTAEPDVVMLKRFLARPTAGATRSLLRGLAACGMYRERVEWLEDRLAGLETTDYAPLPLLTGDDLLAMGMQAGPAFKTILDRVYDAQLEGRLATKADALEWVRSL